MTAKEITYIPVGNRPSLALTCVHFLVSARGYLLALCGLVWFGFLLRLYLLDRFPLREDEALYSYWALHFWRADPWFLQVWPDKPPLFIWLLSLVSQLFGSEQSSGRWLNIALSTATIPILAATARNSWGKPAGLVTALTFALNPFAISFAPTVYTDPLLVFAGSLALYLALTNRAAAAGVWLGIGIMTKQQGLLYLPLIASCLLYHERCATRNTRYVVHQFTRFFCGLALVVCPLVYGDSLRWAVAPSPWDLSVRNYGALRLLPLGEWTARLHEWAPLIWHLTASWIVWLVLVGLGGLALMRKGWFVERSERSPSKGEQLLIPPPYPPLTFWSLIFLTLHLVTTIQPWDRYLLPLTPMLALLAGWVGAQLHGGFPRWFGLGIIGWSLCLLPPATRAATGLLPVGGDHGAYSGLTQAIHWATANFPEQTVLYHQSLGWHFRYYLYDQVAESRYELRWFPSAVYLADNSAKTAGHTQLLITPDWAPVHDLSIHLRMRQVTLLERQRFGHFAVYELVRWPQPLCPWCVCRLARKDAPFATFNFSTSQRKTHG
jgi:4-amino-4-deoxy-L-arabinose transferase-like glycosyltransferase